MRCLACNTKLSNSELISKDPDYCMTCKKASYAQYNYTYDHDYEHEGICNSSIYTTDDFESHADPYDFEE